MLSIFKRRISGCGQFTGLQLFQSLETSQSLIRAYAVDSYTGCIGFIGGGNIAQAIGKGIIKNGVIKPSALYVSEPWEPMQKPWKEMGSNVTTVNGNVIEKCDIVFLAMKTNKLREAVKSIKNTLSGQVENKLFISALAGIPLSTLQKVIRPVIPDARIIRSTLNMPSLVGAGCTVLCGDNNVTEDDITLVKKIMSGIGTCDVLPENQLNAAGGLVGCGPAYVSVERALGQMYVVIDALADGAVKMGVPRNEAIKFAAQTMYGSAKMVLETGKHPGELKDQVCSPGGTTIYGLHALEDSGVRGALIDAIEEAVKRAEDIGEQ